MSQPLRIYWSLNRQPAMRADMRSGYPDELCLDSISQYLMQSGQGGYTVKRRDSLNWESFSSGWRDLSSPLTDPNH